MKKFFIIILLLLTIGCSKEEKVEEVIEKQEEEKIEIVENKYVDDNPIKVGLYDGKKLVHNYNGYFSDKNDIAVFDVYFTNEEELKDNNIKNNWRKYYDQYENIDNYKIGFLVEMEADGKKLENLVLDPSNQHKLHPYLYVYLYDGVHATGRYSHLTMDDLKDDTIFSTIKIYLHHETNKISSPIKLTVFTYKDENDFVDGHYRGNSFYTVEINKK